MTYTMERISYDIAEQLCRLITADLPEYFGLPGCNEHYAEGVSSRQNFAVQVDGIYVSLLSLDFPYPANASIYWMGILREYQRKGMGQALVDQASIYAKSQNAQTMTVETLAPTECDENYLKTYRFYESCEFRPLFNLKPEGYEWNMVYMIKKLD